MCYFCGMDDKTLLTCTALFKDGGRIERKGLKENEGLKEKYCILWKWNKTFSAGYDFSRVQQIARTVCADRFARVLTRTCGIAHVKRKGLQEYPKITNIGT